MFNQFITIFQKKPCNNKGYNHIKVTKVFSKCFPIKLNNVKLNLMQSLRPKEKFYEIKTLND